MIIKHYASCVLRDSTKTKFLTIHHALKAEHPWRFVGGKVSADELPLAAAVRELYEELGITALSIKYLTDKVTEIDSGCWQGHFFLVNQFVGVPALQEREKHNNLAWLTVKQLLDRDSYPEHEVAAGLVQ